MPAHLVSNVKQSLNREVLAEEEEEEEVEEEDQEAGEVEEEVEQPRNTEEEVEEEDDRIQRSRTRVSAGHGISASTSTSSRTELGTRAPAPAIPPSHRADTLSQPEAGLVRSPGLPALLSAGNSGAGSRRDVAPASGPGGLSGGRRDSGLSGGSGNNRHIMAEHGSTGPVLSGAGGVSSNGGLPAPVSERASEGCVSTFGPISDAAGMELESITMGLAGSQKVGMGRRTRLAASLPSARFQLGEAISHCAPS